MTHADVQAWIDSLDTAAPLPCAGMQIRWSNVALRSLERLHAFPAPVNACADRSMLKRLKEAPRTLQAQPHMGKPLPEFSPREVRRLIVSDHALRCEVTAAAVIILRLWHPRKDR